MPSFWFFGLCAKREKRRLDAFPLHREDGLRIVQFKAHIGTLQMASAFSINVEEVSRDMIAFMNSEACGHVHGVTILNDFPGYAVGLVACGPEAEHSVSSTRWRMKAFHASLEDGLICRENMYKTVQKTVNSAVDDIIARNARFASVCTSPTSAHVVLFSPAAVAPLRIAGTAGAPDTDQLGELRADVYMGKRDDIMVSSLNLTRSVASLGPSLVTAIQRRRSDIVDISVATSDTGSYGILWYRAGGAGKPAPSYLTPSTIGITKYGSFTRELYHQAIDAACSRLVSCQGPLLFDGDSCKVCVSMLVFHDGRKGNPTKFMQAVVSNSSTCALL